MVEGAFSFECNCVYVRVWWSKIYQVSSEIFDRMEVELILVGKKKMK